MSIRGPLMSRCWCIAITKKKFAQKIHKNKRFQVLCALFKNPLETTKDEIELRTSFRLHHFFSMSVLVLSAWKPISKMHSEWMQERIKMYSFFFRDKNNQKTKEEHTKKEEWQREMERKKAKLLFEMNPTTKLPVN